MKKVLLMFLLLVAITLPCFAQETNAAGIPENWLKVLGYILALYEVAARIVPTVKDYTIVSRLYKFLHWLLQANNLKAD